MARVEVDLNAMDNISFTEIDKFKPFLYSNLSIPSYIHGYALGIEYMKKWFLEKFPANYFKYVHINGKHLFDDLKQFNNQNIVKENPILVITPTVETDWDNDNLDLYLAGRDLFLKRSDYQRSFFQDTEKKLYLAFQTQQLKMNFNFRIRLNSKAQQMDVYKNMELAMRIGATQSKYTIADFVIPRDILLNIAKANGFEIKNNEITKPTSFLKYLNTHSQIPISYKLRTINNRLEYFMQLDNLYTHITCANKLSLDDGESIGKLFTNYVIDFECSLKIPVPHFFVYYNEKPLECNLNLEKGGLGIYSLKQFFIPDLDNNKWYLMINTDYKCEAGEGEIDLTPLFKGTDLEKMINNSLSKFISPLSFLNIEIHEEKAGEYPIKNSKIDFNTMKITFEPYKDETVIYIGVYANKEYINEIMYVENKINNGRIQ